MVSGCCSFQATAEQKFDAKLAALDLESYRVKGPNRTTLLLRDVLTDAHQVHGSLLDIGFGVGAVTFELLGLGISRAIVVDTSSAYLAAASEEAARRDCVGATQFVHGDFLSVASELPDATVVTLDRVICCYPAYSALLEEALRHAQLYFALSYPRDVWHVHVAQGIENGIRRLASNPFRAFVHSARRLENVIGNAGFTLTSRRQTWNWRADVYVRQSS